MLFFSAKYTTGPRALQSAAPCRLGGRALPFSANVVPLKPE
jgi:hypothetical protein